jgi:SAM-dependent methyltransferase
LETSSPCAALYSAEFFQSLRDGSRRSAEIVVPVLMELFQPKSILDVGCGTGEWLSAFREHGVADVLGVDGAWTEGAPRELPDSCFRQHDLRQPLKLDRPFDLAVCLEVAEHLPPEAAQPLVESLTRLAPIVLFSAAIPCQGGDGHINEKWPSFWSDLFASHGYRCPIDLRSRFWANDAIEFWYRQNMACYVAEGRLDLLRWLSSEQGSAPKAPLDVVHPDLYFRVVRESDRRRQRADKLELKSQRMRAELNQARGELARIKSSMAWRCYQAVRPAVLAGRRVGSLLRIR